jgi:hypothetical protein
MIERYYLVEKLKEPFMIDAFNMHVVRQAGKNLEMLSSEKIKPADIGIKLNKFNKILCTNKQYAITEITEEKASRILKNLKKNYLSWQNYMSGAENMASNHLFGIGGEILA